MENSVEEKLVYEFLDSIKDEELRKFIQNDVEETIYSIEMCYNFEYREFLKNNNVENWDVPIFKYIDNEKFAFYISKRFNIKLKEIRYFEFDVE